ncbi:hypothetical protein G7Z17_g6112 [Cylindrodendrum hubeiense]|uniref:Uncharacterized protein n=1 Tax=Cylindrodendrum hubeiense TaxID=595255 RepID=A0A9P5HFU3_9HYPO|nr:hypothetical protein G7Z17_g6112 [Cylindrodendrum hubeiense]
MYLGELVVGIAYLVVLAATTPTLGLTSSRLTRGDTVELQWSGVSEGLYPLSLQARFFNETDDGVFSIRSTIANGLTRDRFDWEDIPAPLDHVPNARYELILLPEGERGPRVAYEGLFRVVEAEDSDETDDDSSPGDSSEGDSPRARLDQDDDDGDDNQRVAIGTGVGLGLGLPVVLGSAWLLRRRRNRMDGWRRETEK